MPNDAAKAERLGIFISYSRRDALDFADQLAKALEILGYRPIIDREGISGGEFWQVRLGQMLLECDTVVFVMSPESAVSPVCAWEVDEAARLSKRILPAIAMPLGTAKPPERLQQLNFIHFYAEKSVPGSGFGDGLVKLNVALKSDLDWLREHTRLLERATEWDKGNRTPNRMLSGADIGAAKAWEARRPKDAPAPTTLQLDYIKASEAHEAAQQSERQRQLEERERLVRQAEADRAAREAQQLRASRLAWTSAALAMLVAVVGGGFGYYSHRLSVTSESRRLDAEAAKATATAEADKAKAANDRSAQYIEKIAVQQRKQQIARLQAIEKKFSADAIDYLIKTEIGSRSDYEKRYHFPEASTGQSGVSIGFGYDLGYHTKSDFIGDWEPFLLTDDIKRLESVIGAKGQEARDKLAAVRDIIIPYTAADFVFRISALSKVNGQLNEVFPASDRLPPDCAGSLMSVVYNVGTSLEGPRRLEMRNVQRDLIIGDLGDIPNQIRAMKRHWPDTFVGIRNRRDEEAAMFQRCLDTEQGQALSLLTPAQKLVVAGFAHFATGDEPAADKEFSEAATLDDKIAQHLNEIRALACFRKGQGLLDRGDKTAASVAFERAKKLDPSISESISIIWRGIVQGNLDRGRDLAADDLDSEPDKVAKAKAEFDAALVNAPGFESEIRAACIEAFMATAGDYLSVPNEKGEVLGGKKVEAALACVTSDAERANILARASQIRTDAKKPAKGLEYAERAVALKGTALSWSSRGKALAALDHCDQAFVDFEHVLSVDAAKDQPVGARERDPTQASFQKCDRDLPNFNCAVNAFSPRLQTYFARGQCQEKADHPDLAIQDYRQVLTIETDLVADELVQTDARKRLKLLGVKIGDAREYKESASQAFLDVALNGKDPKQLEQALDDSNKALELTPGDPEIHETRGQIYVALGNADAALADLDAVIGDTDARPDAGTLYARGRAYELKGDNGAALADYLKALDSETSAFSDYAKYAQSEARKRVTALRASPPR